MPTPDQLAEMHVREHEARLKHIDELVEKAWRCLDLTAESLEAF